MKTLSFAIALCLSLFVYSCNNAVEYTAEQLTVQGLATTPGFAWFNDKVAAYVPDPANVSALKTAYATDPFSTLVYVNPTCSCTGTQYHFPDMIATLRKAGIPDSTVTIFSMHNAETKQPYSALYPVSSLPTFYFVRASKAVVSVVPVDGTSSGIDTLMVAKLK